MGWNCILELLQMLVFRQLNKHKQNNSKHVNKQTDQLYEPLRNALRKSTLAGNFLSTDKRSQYNNLSPAGKKMRVITPAEAQNIKKGIMIPFEKQLVPTGNIQRIIGKKFTPVDVNERVGEPLTPEQFNMKRRGGVEEIVYEVKDENPYQIYTSRQHPQSSKLPKKMTQSSLLGSPAKIMSKISDEMPKPLFMSHSSKDLIQGKQLTLSLSSPKTQSSATPTNKYNFKESMKRMSQPIKDQYKYNLFSVVDQACNTSCHRGCCAQNELIAGKVQQKAWV